MILENNSLIALQEQLAGLVSAHPYFAGVPVLTERLADLAAKVDNAILRVGGYGVVITTASGTRHGAPGGTEELPLVLTEELAVTIIHAPLLDTTRRVLDGVLAVLEAVDGRPSPQPLLPWRVLGHEHDGNPSGIVLHHVRVSTLLTF